ncbi:MAG: AI-2E family transporter [Myxococcales bacterium]
MDAAAVSGKKPIRAGIVLIAVVATIAALWLAREIVLLGFLGVLIAVVFSFPVNWISRLLPRGVAVIIVLLLLIGAVVGLGLLIAPTLSREFGELQQRVPKAVQSARSYLSRSAPGGEQLAQKAPEAVKQVGEKAVPALLALVSGITGIVLVIVLGAFLVAQPDVYRRGVRAMIPPQHEEKFDESWRRLGEGLRKWVGGILVAMTIMGTLTAIGLKIAGIEEWFLLGVLTFLGTFVPYVGAVASSVPGILAALAQSPTKALWAAVVYLGVHVVEGYLVEPLVMKRAVEVKPALLLFGQGLFSAVFGLMGTVVATPLIVCAQTLIDYLWVERKLQKTPTR